MKEDYEPEVWVPMNLEGYEYSYTVSNYGRVWSNSLCRCVAQNLTGIPAYYYVNLKNTLGERTNKRVHNLMLRSFVGVPEDTQMTVDHIDQNKYNNCLWNLRWADKKTQMNNRWNNIRVVCNKRGDVAPLLPTLRKAGLGAYYSRIRSCVVDDGLSYEEALLKVRESDKPRIIEVIMKDQSNILLTDKHYFPSLKAFDEYHYVSPERRVSQTKEGMSLQDIVDYDRKDLRRFSLEGFFMTREEHCIRVGTSIARVLVCIDNHNMSFEDALKVKPQRIIKHTINGVVKRNRDWFIHFGIPPIRGNGKLGKKKSKCYQSLRKTLESFGVDTSEMTITPYI